MRSLSRAALAAVLFLLAVPAASARPLVPILDAAAVTRNCEAALERGRRDVAAMEKRPGPAGFLDEWNRLQIGLEDINAIYLLGSVSPDKAVRDAAEPCLVKFTTLNTEVYQNERLFRRAQALKPANPRQAKLRKDLVEAFEDGGVALPADKRARAKAIIDRIEELRQEFDRNIRDDPTRVAFTPAEMERMPPAYLRAHEGTRDKDGNYLLSLQYPSYVPFMANAGNAQARRRYYLAKLSEGGAKNLEHLHEIFRLRKELAALHGLPTFAHYSLRRKMAGTPEAVNKFLADVKDKVTELEKADIEELRTEKARDTGKPAAEIRVDRWDVSYYQERVRKARYSIDQEELRKYFPTDKSIDFVLAISSRLYGVRFKEIKVVAWHPDVRYFDVLDAKTGAFVSGFYLDPFPREGKYGHPAAFPVRGTSTRARRTPLSVLVTNFNREGLDHDELATLLHEFGHVLHAVLSRAEYNPHAGTSVKVDFVEAPSQMFEEWGRREQSLAVFRQVCPRCPQLTAAEIARLDSARKYARGMRYARQWLFGAFDMALSTDPQPPLEVWRSLEAATPLGHVEGTMFPASFSHLTAQYGAGYYGYMWSEVLALDMLSAFDKNMLDPAVGKRYRDSVLAQGSQQEEMEMVRKFLGREPSNKAFLEEISGRR